MNIQISISTAITSGWKDPLKIIQRITMDAATYVGLTATPDSLPSYCTLIFPVTGQLGRKAK